MIIREPTEHLRKICSNLGREYSIKVIDLEQVIYRNFRNGYDVEISGLNKNSHRAKANIYLWKNCQTLERAVYGVAQNRIAETVESLYKETCNQKGIDG